LVVEWERRVVPEMGDQECDFEGSFDSRDIAGEDFSRE
jgi:hypothetical protein